MTSVCSVIERRRQIRLPRESTEPFAVLVDEAAKFPCRQFELDQCKRRVTPSADLDQLIDPSSLYSRKARAGVGDDMRDQIGRDRVGTTKLFLQLIKGILVFRVEQHDIHLTRSTVHDHRTRRWGQRS